MTRIMRTRLLSQWELSLLSLILFLLLNLSTNALDAKVQGEIPGGIRIMFMVMSLRHTLTAVQIPKGISERKCL